MQRYDHSSTLLHFFTRGRRRAEDGRRQGQKEEEEEEEEEKRKESLACPPFFHTSHSSLHFFIGAAYEQHLSFLPFTMPLPLIFCLFIRVFIRVILILLISMSLPLLSCVLITKVHPIEAPLKHILGDLGVVLDILLGVVLRSPILAGLHECSFPFLI